MGSAPAAVSDDLQQYVKFASGTKAGTLRIEACVPIYQICSNYYSGSLVKGGLSLGPTDSFPYAALTAIGGFYGGGGSDVDKNFISPVFKLLGSTFVRYDTLKCEFIYEPQSATTVEDRLVFAFANDPEHPMIKNTPATASQTKLLALQDSVAFAPWRAWRLDVSSTITAKTELFNYNQDISSELDNRFLAFASIGCLASVEPTSTTAQTVYGILYAKFAFEYYELCPIATTVSLSSVSESIVKVVEDCCDDTNCKRCTRKCLHHKENPLRATIGKKG